MMKWKVRKDESSQYVYLYTFMYFLLFYNKDGMFSYLGEERDILPTPPPHQEEEKWGEEEKETEI